MIGRKRVVVLESARRDLIASFEFYERQSPGVGSYFLRRVVETIDTLRETAGVHRRFGVRHYWLMVRRFSHAVYYYVDDEAAYVTAIIDCRRSPDWIRKHILP